VAPDAPVPQAPAKPLLYRYRTENSCSAEHVRGMTEARTALVERLFAAHRSALQAFFYRRIRHRPDAADLAQEVYLRMLRISDPEAIRDPDAYLYTVASNLMRESAAGGPHRDARVDVEEVSVDEQLAELMSFDAAIDAEKRVQRLRQVLQELPPKCHAAAVFQLRYDLSYQEIAERLGISTHMVKKYLRQALWHCRRRMVEAG
jgi:RNA polymerase sigma factor (sigma-70 family)